MIAGEFLDEKSYLDGMDGLVQWKEDPAAALWYSLCWAEGEVPLNTI